MLERNWTSRYIMKIVYDVDSYNCKLVLWLLEKKIEPLHYDIK